MISTTNYAQQATSAGLGAYRQRWMQGVGPPVEHWRRIPWYPDYEVSDWGHVRTYKVRGSKHKVSLMPRPLKQFGDGRGRLCVKLEGKTHKVHKLVMWAFVGPRPEGMDIDHLDGNPHNNRLDNLTYETPALNRGSLRFRRRAAA